MARDNYPAREIETSAVDWAVALLKRRQDLMKQDDYTPSHNRHLRDMLSSVSWYWGGKGRHKYLGVPTWSEAALQSFKRHGEVMSGKGSADALAHEHVVPRRAVVDALLDLEDVSSETVRDLLTRVALVAVVTAAEHERLDDRNVDLDDPWKRYRTAGVTVVTGAAVREALGDAARFAG